ncbi:hypothetical protein IWX81_001215 [Salinibacterium sp. CAN_S4]|uniref:fumarate hydratase n=1 Tax=Salinibacterium sp. CAN_S4 TaxID=2787727 RepID=UPI0018EFFBA7
MSWVIGALAVTLGIVFLWGLFAPRSQWRTLSAWLVSNPGAHEPSGAAYGWRRFLSGVGVLGLLVVAGSAYSADLARQPRPGPPVTAVEQMWGSPTPTLVDRAVSPLDAPPAGFVDEPILGFQRFDDGRPEYLRALSAFSILGDANMPGYVGSPGDGTVSPVGASNLVVNVRGPLLCIPRQVVVLESETAIQIAVYYGLRDPLTGAAPDHVAGCPLEGVVTSSVLIPIELSGPVGERVVQNLAGNAVPEVAVVE